jgi:hypothetical protein
VGGLQMTIVESYNFDMAKAMWIQLVGKEQPIKTMADKIEIPVQSSREKPTSAKYILSRGEEKLANSNRNT